MKVGDLVRLSRVRANSLDDEDTLYVGIYLYGERNLWFVECGFQRVGQFSPDFWKCEVINENW